VCKKQYIMFFMLFLSGCSFFKKKAKDSNVLIVGTNTPFSPYEIINDQGNLEGFDIDLAQEISKRLNKKVEFRDVAFDILITSLQNKKIDIIMAGMSITKDKLNEIGMVCYLENDRTHYPIVFWEKIPDGVKAVEDIKILKNRTVAVQAGTIQEQYLEKNNFIEIRNMDGVNDLILEVKHKKTLAFCIDMPVFKKLQKQVPQLKALLVPIPEGCKTEGDGIGIHKENQTLKRDIERVIKQLKQEGFLEDLKKKWFDTKG
jgi:arginine transport system substrate-binding protein